MKLTFIFIIYCHYCIIFLIIILITLNRFWLNVNSSFGSNFRLPLISIALLILTIKLLNIKKTTKGIVYPLMNFI